MTDIAPRRTPADLDTHRPDAALGRGDTHLRADVDAAIARTQRRVLSWQHADGAFEGQTFAGPISTCAVLVLERALGELEPTRAARLTAGLVAQQRADGGLPAWPFADDAHIDATVAFEAALESAGVMASAPERRRAQAFIAARGGLAAANPVVRLLSVVAGLEPASALPRVPLAWKWVPGHESALATVLGPNSLMPLHTFAPLLWALQGGRQRPLGGALAARARSYLEDRQDPEGGWMGISFLSLAAALTLVKLGTPADDPIIRRALAWSRGHDVAARVDGGELRPARDEGGAVLMHPPFRSTFWDSAQLVRGLLLSGLPARHPAIRAAVEYLIRHQGTAAGPADWQTLPTGTQADGGWSFQPGNDKNPDFDSTQEVLGALAAAWARGCDAPGLEASITRGRRFLLGVQNWDGGWSSFSWGKPGQPPGAMHLPALAGPRGRVERLADLARRASSRLAEVGDPSNADITARALWTLGELGLRRGDPAVDRARAYLDYQRDPGQGVWWGRWAINYVPTTAYAVAGLRAVGESPSAPLVAHATRWLVEHQNADGGFGETVDSYHTPALAGRGPSAPGLTGFALWALCAAGQARSAPARRAVGWLLERQRPDGDFETTSNQGVLMPGVGYYWNDTFAAYLALMGLGSWAADVRVEA